MQSQVLQNVAVRIDLAFRAFLRRVKAGEAPGSPRFRGHGRYDSSTFPQVPVGCKLEAGTGRLHVMHVGHIKLIYHRLLEGTPKTATIRRSSTGKWYVAFSCECAEPPPLPQTGQQVGIAVGLKTFAMLSTEEAIATPPFFRREEKALAKAQRRLSKAEKGPPERAARRQVVARGYERSPWRRGDFAHQHSRRIVDAFDLIAVEDLAVNRRTHNHCLARSIHDAAWSQFSDLLWYTAAWAGRSYVAVTPAYTTQDCHDAGLPRRRTATTQDCSQCGHRQVLSLSDPLSDPLSDRTSTCPCCGVVLDRDLNASLNILRLGQQSLASA